MKIAFASCFDALDDSKQKVWGKVQGTAPDVLLLLGDNVYIDFGIFGDRSIGWPIDASDKEFATELYSRYVAQWGVSSFQNLIRSVPAIGVTWDDHDFAWNNARGDSRKKYYGVPKEKRRISQGLFEQFRDSLRNAKSLKAYPAMPSLETLLQTPDTGIKDTFDIGEVRFIALDGRSFRQNPSNDSDTEMHGLDQRNWAEGLVRAWKGVSVIASGSIMTKGEESWDLYLDYEWLLRIKAGPIVVLTGDVHKNVLPKAHRPKSKTSSAIYEVTSSGAARPGIGGDFGNFGVLTVGEKAIATLYSTESPDGVSTTLTI